MKDRDPPAPPEIPPRVRLNRSEKLGLPFLFILPALAMMGLFGPKTEVAQGRSGAIKWSAEYPSRMRYQNADRVIVRVQNSTSSPLPKISLAFDPAYIHAFTTVAFEPAADTPYTVDIRDLRPGENRLVSIELTADEYGSHQGWLSLSADGVQARTELSTFVFP